MIATFSFHQPRPGVQRLANSGWKRALARIPGVLPLYQAMRGPADALWFRGQYRDFCRALARSHAPDRFPVRWGDRHPFYGDRSAATPFDRHYIYHPAWAARILAAERPALHVDFSSTLHFCTMLSAFVPVEFYDYRPADVRLPHLVSKHADLTNIALPSGSIASLSCMHVVEHVGLGRYGDPLDPDGDVKAMHELERILAPGGNLLFVVPVGKPRIEFNAHRIYSYAQVIEKFAGLTLVEFSLIPDDGSPEGIISDAAPGLVEQQNFACGCFWFRK
jgi:hypothetical protein